MPSNHFILCRPPFFLTSVFPSDGYFSKEYVLHIMWPKYLCFSFSISPCNEYSGLIFFMTDCLSSCTPSPAPQCKASMLSCSAFFMVQLSHPYTTTGKTICLTRWTFVGKVMSLFLNMLSRFVIAFLPRSKHILNIWLQSPSTVILDPEKIKSLTVSIASPIYLPWSDGTTCHDLCFLNVRF